jgi:hypothetical protein
MLCKPGLHMKVSPMFVAWQNEKPCVITDHTRSGINDGIPQSEAKVKYDDMRTFGQNLHNARSSNPGRCLVTFKSDVVSAFLNLPAHPIFQLRQVVRIEGKLFIVRWLVFGNRASPRCWCAVSGLLCWLGVRKLGIASLHVYMDDFFGWDYADNLVWYRGKLRPCRQVQFLLLWESISCPFKDRKQEHGEALKIIGFWVDINAGSISLPPSTVSDIITKIDLFLTRSLTIPLHVAMLSGTLELDAKCATLGTTSPVRNVPQNQWQILVASRNSHQCGCHC